MVSSGHFSQPFGPDLVVESRYFLDRSVELLAALSVELARTVLFLVLEAGPCLGDALLELMFREGGARPASAT